MFAPLPKKVEPIDIIGLDCDDPSALEKILRSQQHLLQKVDIICGAKQILKHLGHDAELAGRLLPLTPPLEPLFDCLANLRAEGMRVAVLANGDPLFFDIGASLAHRLGPDAIRIQPAISSLQAACARLSLPWHNVYTISLHGRDDLLPLYAAISRDQPVCILTGGNTGPDVLARLLLDHGADWFTINVFENMGREGESCRSMSLEECAASSFGNSATIILTPSGVPRFPKVGLDDTKLKGTHSSSRPERGVTLELLRVFPRNTVWDIGSGSGIIALEICALAHAGRVIAVEHDPDRAFNIQQNRSRLGAVNLGIALAHAPDCLADLPEPDRIFIGGGLAAPDALDLLEKCASALPSGGRMVASCQLLESMALYRQFMEKLGWPVEMLQIQASRAATTIGGEYFAPMNPAFLLAVQKP